MEPKILDAMASAPHVGCKGGTTMVSFLRTLLVQQPRLGFSATLPEIDGMP